MPLPTNVRSYCYHRPMKPKPKPKPPETPSAAVLEFRFFKYLTDQERVAMLLGLGVITPDMAPELTQHSTMSRCFRRGISQGKAADFARAIPDAEPAPPPRKYANMLKTLLQWQKLGYHPKWGEKPHLIGNQRLFATFQMRAITPSR